MASCLADLKQSHDALWSAAANAGLHTPQPGEPATTSTVMGA